jgi:hypothetical protein
MGSELVRGDVLRVSRGSGCQCSSVRMRIEPSGSSSDVTMQL